MGRLGFAHQGFNIVFDFGIDRIDKRFRGITEAVISLEGSIEAFDQTCCTRHLIFKQSHPQKHYTEPTTDCSKNDSSAEKIRHLKIND